jgi:hypothetical protein
MDIGGGLLEEEGEAHGADNIYEQEGLSEEESDGGDFDNGGGIKYTYRDDTWKQDHFTYDPKPRHFIGVSGPTRWWNQMPTMMQLFELFWSFTILQDIVNETNRYATSRNGDGILPGGAGWQLLTVAEFKAWLAIWLYMGMKRHPNMKSYWMKEGSIFHCPIISKTMSRDRFKALTRCFHITNPATYVREKGLPGYDKLGQTRWLVDSIRESCKRVWQLGKMCTIDEMMIRYKGTYCPLRQYMPQKPQKWRIKIWCMACSVTKFVWNFAVYCGKTDETEKVPRIARREPRLAHKVVLDLAAEVQGKGHVISMDNFFTSVGLFEELASMQIYAIGTMCTNKIGLPSVLKNTGAFKNVPQGTLEWRMHETRKMACVLWKDKKPVLLLSTHAIPIGYPCMPVPTVPRRNGAERENIMTSPVHLEYTTHMRGVDVADQLRASYSTQNRTHKWLYRIFFLPPRYDSGKYVHHLPCEVQETIETTSYAFAVWGGVMRYTSTTMEMYGAPRALTSARLLLPCIH